MILLIDNYDSFVFNLARYCAKLGCEYTVIRNDKITVEDIEKMKPSAIIISPGPCAPDSAGSSKAIIDHFSNIIPILGVCLGHQAIAEVFGGKTVQAKHPMHGKTSTLTHDGSPLFDGINNPFDAARYHSLIIELPQNSPFTVTAHSEDNTIMAIAHKDKPVYGIQFHPESVLTPDGLQILKNFLTIATAWNKEKDEAA